MVALIVWIGRWKLGGNNSIDGGAIPSADLSAPISSPDSIAPAPAISSSPTPTSPSKTATPVISSGKYRNGTFTGSAADAYYGSIQLKITVASGKISQVTILNYPSDNRTSQRINTQALPQLQQEVLKTQTGPVDAISGASFSSQAFNQSLQSALRQAGA